MPSMLRTKEEIAQIYDRHVDSIYRLCFSFMKNKADAEDMVQDTFLRLVNSGKEFESEKHEKAWLIVTASNLCKDALKKSWRKSKHIEDCYDLPQEQGTEDPDVTNAILALPKDYKTVVYMYYYEGYTTVEIARHLQCPEVTVRSRLSRARAQLRTMLGGENK